MEEITSTDVTRSNPKTPSIFNAFRVPDASPLPILEEILKEPLLKEFITNELNRFKADLKKFRENKAVKLVPSGWFEYMLEVRETALEEIARLEAIERRFGDNSKRSNGSIERFKKKLRHYSRWHQKKSRLCPIELQIDPLRPTDVQEGIDLILRMHNETLNIFGWRKAKQTNQKKIRIPKIASNFPSRILQKYEGKLKRAVGRYLKGTDYQQRRIAILHILSDCFTEIREKIKGIKSSKKHLFFLIVSSGKPKRYNEILNLPKILQIDPKTARSWFDEWRKNPVKCLAKAAESIQRTYDEKPQDALDHPRSSDRSV